MGLVVDLEVVLDQEVVRDQEVVLEQEVVLNQEVVLDLEVQQVLGVVVEAGVELIQQGAVETVFSHSSSVVASSTAAPQLMETLLPGAQQVWIPVETMVVLGNTVRNLLVQELLHLL